MKTRKVRRPEGPETDHVYNPVTLDGKCVECMKPQDVHNQPQAATERVRSTPGPWSHPAQHVGVYEGPNSSLVADCGTSAKDRAEQIANAQLIAAAPELLEALQNIKANLKGTDNMQERIADSFERAVNAIAKVEGR